MFYLTKKNNLSTLQSNVVNVLACQKCDYYVITKNNVKSMTTNKCKHLLEFWFRAESSKIAKALANKFVYFTISQSDIVEVKLAKHPNLEDLEFEATLHIYKCNPCDYIVITKTKAAGIKTNKCKHLLELGTSSSMAKSASLQEAVCGFYLLLPNQKQSTFFC